MDELLIVLSVVILAGAWLGRRYWRAAQQGPSCPGCGGSCGCDCGATSCQGELPSCHAEAQALETAQPPRREK